MVKERERKKNKDKKNKRGRVALTRQHPLLFPRSRASRLPLKQNYKGEEGGGKKSQKPEKEGRETRGLRFNVTTRVSERKHRTDQNFQHIYVDTLFYSPQFAGGEKCIKTA